MPVPTIRPFVLGDFQTNCHVVTVPESTACWIVDCGYEPGPMLEAIEREGLQPTALLLTHCHADHMAGVDQALNRFGDMPVYVHESEVEWCSNPMLNLSAMLGLNVTCAAPDRRVDDGDTLEFEGTTWRVLHAPGHSPGSVVFVHDDSRQAIVGDTLFAGGIGRFDFPTSNVADLRRSIADVLMNLPDDMTIYPGHGPSTTIGHERHTNPFVLHGF